MAWLITEHVVCHEAPFFAPFAVVVGFNAALGRHGSNAVRLLLGVAVGIVIGEIVVAVTGAGVITLMLATFTAMFVARLVDSSRIVVAQAVSEPSMPHSEIRQKVSDACEAGERSDAYHEEVAV